MSDELYQKYCDSRHIPTELREACRKDFEASGDFQFFKLGVAIEKFWHDLMESAHPIVRWVAERFRK